MSGYLNFRKQPIRMPVSPYDKSTIVSICPFPIHEVKPTIFPGYFDFPEVKDGDFELLVVGPSSWFKDIGPKQPAVEVQESSYYIAKSIVDDFMNGLFCCDMKDKKPGLFSIPGKHDKLTIQTWKDDNGKTFAAYLSDARIRQDNWLKSIIDETDALWARTNENPRVVGRDALVAAQRLGIKRDWTGETRSAEFSPCPSCGNRINMAFPVCQHCKVVVNPEKFKALGLQFAS